MIIRRIKVFVFLIYLDCFCLFVVPGAVGRMNRLNHEAHQQSLAKFAPLPLPAHSLVPGCTSDWACVYVCRLAVSV